MVIEYRFSTLYSNHSSISKPPFVNCSKPTLADFIRWRELVGCLNNLFKGEDKRLNGSTGSIGRTIRIGQPVS